MKFLHSGEIYMLSSIFKNPRFADKVTQDLSKKINAKEPEVRQAIKELEPTWEQTLTEQIEAKVLANRRELLDKTLAETEEQQKLTPY